MSIYPPVLSDHFSIKISSEPDSYFPVIAPFALFNTSIFPKHCTRAFIHPIDPISNEYKSLSLCYSHSFSSNFAGSSLITLIDFILHLVPFLEVSFALYSLQTIRFSTKFDLSPVPVQCFMYVDDSLLILHHRGYLLF